VEYSDPKRPWRDEKIIIAFRPRLTPLEKTGVGDWLVLPGIKLLNPGQTVTWKSVPDANIELFLPDVFTQTHVKGRGVVKATVKDKPPSAFYFYEAYCDGQLATGGSSPGVIIDP
jgi:hypothetical protein